MTKGNGGGDGGGFNKCCPHLMQFPCTSEDVSLHFYTNHIPVPQLLNNCSFLFTKNKHAISQSNNKIIIDLLVTGFHFLLFRLVREERGDREARRLLPRDPSSIDPLSLRHHHLLQPAGFLFVVSGNIVAGRYLMGEKGIMAAVTTTKPIGNPSAGSSAGRDDKSGRNQQLKEKMDQRIRDTVGLQDKDSDAIVVTGNQTEAGQIIECTVGGSDGKPKQTISYLAERVVGSGSFGVVFQAKCLETGESIAIKKVLQDKRYKNRELSVMRMLNHPNVVQLKQSFFSTNEKDELYLNLVLEYVSETVYRVSKHFSRVNQFMPTIYIQLYAYQICRALNYIHNVIGVCHRDIKPQNLLVNPHTHQLKLCDFGSAKMLLPGEPNISYICSRYYRAPELIFGATEYTTAIDMWSAGCVLAELLLGNPIFPGESGVDQLVEIIKILGTPTREEIKCMNPNYSEFKFPQIKSHPWHKVFDKRMPPEAIDLVSRLLQYSPKLRCTALEACAHPFFDDLRNPNTRLPNGKPLPPLFDFTPQELSGASQDLRNRLIPEHIRKQQQDP